MTENEWFQISGYLKSGYSGRQFLNDPADVEIWFRELKDLDAVKLTLAARKFVSTSKFPPTIAELREAAAEIENGEMPAWEDGWQEIVRAIRKYGYYKPEEALDSMTPLTRQCAERLGFLNLCTSENLQVDRANFRMIYTELSERRRKEEQINPSLLDAIKKAQGSKYTEIPEKENPKIEDFRTGGIPMPEDVMKMMRDLMEGQG